MGRNKQSKDGGYARNTGTSPYAGSKGCQRKSKAVDAATALGLGVPQQKPMLPGLAGLGMAQQNPLDSLFGSAGTNPLAGIAGLIRLGGNNVMQLAAFLGGPQQSDMFQHAQLLQVRQALVQQQAAYGGSCTASRSRSTEPHRG